MTSKQNLASGIRPPEPGLAILIILGASTAIAPFSTDMYLPALPQIARELGTGIGALQLTVSTFFIGLAFGQLVYGPLSDRVGRRAPLIGGLLLYGCASVGCAMAESTWLLCVLRFGQAFGGCAGLVICRAIVRDLFGPDRLLHVFAWLTTIMAISPIVAPLVGGWLLLVVHWHWLFVIQAVASLLLIAAIWRILPESRSDATARRARAESVAASYRRLLRRRDLRRYLFVGACSGAALYTWVACSADIVIEQLGIPPRHFGYVFGINTVGLVVGTQINARLARILPYRRILAGSIAATAAVAGVMLLLAEFRYGGAWGILIPVFLIVASLGFTQPNATAGALDIDPQRSGATAALYGSIGSFSGAAAASLASWLHDGTARPVALIMFVSLACGWLVARRIAATDPRVAPRRA